MLAQMLRPCNNAAANHHALLHKYQTFDFTDVRTLKPLTYHFVGTLKKSLILDQSYIPPRFAFFARQL